MHRTLTDVGATVAASAVMLIVVVAGARLMTPTEPTATERSATTSCLTQPMVAAGDTPVQAAATLCLSMGGVQPTVELTGLPAGSIYTAWLAHLEQPRSWQIGRCASAQQAAQASTTIPGRIDSGTVDQSGWIVLSSMLPAMRFGGDSEVEILVVDHGQPAVAGGLTATWQPLAWDPSWYGSLPTPTALVTASSRVVGCAAFWLRGGAEQTEH